VYADAEIEVDPLLCPQCGGEMKVIFFIEDRFAVCVALSLFFSSDLAVLCMICLF
jgi:uncharacterized protein (UPF0212 family)